MGAKYKPGDPDYIPTDITDHDRQAKHPSYGWISLGFLLIAGALAYISYHYVAKTLCNFDFAGNDLSLSGLSAVASLLSVMIALALAGAGLATNRGNIGALFTLVLTFAPVVILLVGFIYGWSPDFSSSEPTPVFDTSISADLTDETLPLDTETSTCPF